jgi:FdhD protein
MGISVSKVASDTHISRRRSDAFVSSLQGNYSMRRITRYSESEVEETTDALVEEAPVEFRLGGVPIAVLMRTPGDDENLALGFALTEGIVLHRGEVKGVRLVEGDNEGDRYEILLADDVRIDPEQFRRNLYTSSSCGVCGKASIDAVRVAARPVPKGPEVAVSTLRRLPSGMRASQDLFATTGSIHAAAAFTSQGDLVGIAEDVGRHNAVDKLVGKLAKDRWPLTDLVLLVSGRLSFEMVQKAAVAGIPIILGISGASSLAVDLGEEFGMTVIGFLSEDGFNVYCGNTRII